MKSLLTPAIPNSPLTSITDKQQFGELRLRLNRALHFIENGAFQPRLATYDENYQNSQAHSKVFLQHMQDVLKLLKQEVPEGSLIVEVGCGKGDFIELLQTDGYFEVRGFDATYDGMNPVIEKRYLASDDRIDADLIVLRHVLEHVQAPHEFLAMLKDVFRKAKIYIEVPAYDWISKNQAFFDITYEHVNYFSQHSLRALFDNSASISGLCFGDQYQYLVTDISSFSETFGELYENGKWEDLEFDVLFPSLTEKISRIEKLLGASSKLYIWGAATKGCMFLVHCAHRNQLVNQVAFAVDVNPQKIGKYLPGSLVQIKGRDDFFDSVKAGDVLLIVNSNYEDEIVSEIQDHGVTGINIVCLS